MPEHESRHLDFGVRKDCQRFTLCILYLSFPGPLASPVWQLPFPMHRNQTACCLARVYLFSVCVFLFLFCFSSLHLFQPFCASDMLSSFPHKLPPLSYHLTQHTAFLSHQCTRNTTPAFMQWAKVKSRHTKNIVEDYLWGVFKVCMKPSWISCLELSPSWAISWLCKCRSPLIGKHLKSIWPQIFRIRDTFL